MLIAGCQLKGAPCLRFTYANASLITSTSAHAASPVSHCRSVLKAHAIPTNLTHPINRPPSKLTHPPSMNDISRASSTLDAPLRLLYTLPTEHPRALLTLSLGALLITPPVLSYRAYAGRKASAGVYTSDVAGWLRRMLFLPFFRETRSTAMYDSDPNTDRWLLPDELPCREGERPVWDSSIGPQRQVDQLPSLEMREV